MAIPNSIANAVSSIIFIENLILMLLCISAGEAFSGILRSQRTS